jgi:hypothetical protein
MHAGKLVVVAAILLQGTAVAAEQTPVASSDPTAQAVAVGLAELTKAVASLADDLHKSVAQNEIALKMKRLELSTFMLIEAKRRAAELVQERDMIKESIFNYSESMTQLADSEEQEASAEDEERRQAVIRSYERQQVHDKAKLKTIEAGIAEAEGTIAQTQQEIQDWEAVVNRYFQNQR